MVAMNLQMLFYFILVFKILFESERAWAGGGAGEADSPLNLESEAKRGSRPFRNAILN